MKSYRKFFCKNELLIIAVLAFLFYFFLAVVKPIGIFWSLDEGGKWIYMENVLRTGNPRAPLIYPGRYLDTNLESVPLFFYGRIGHQIYTWWPVGFPLLTLPFYKILGWAGMFLLPALAGAITVYFSAKIAETLSGSKTTSRAVALITAFATPVAFYSMTFWEHTLSVAGVVVTLYLILLSKERNSAFPMLIGGISGSLAIFFRQEAGLIILGTGIAVLLINWRRAIPYAIGGVVTASTWVLVNLWLTGYPISPSINSVQSISSFTALTSLGVRFIPYTLFNSPTIGAFDLGDTLLIFVTALAVLAFLFGMYRRTFWLSLCLTIGVTIICAYVLLQPSLYRSVHGFILICPFVLLSSLVYRSQAWRANREFRIVIGIGLIVYIIGYILRAWASAGGLQWGPRYLLALYPIMVIAAVLGIQDVVSRLTARQRAVILASAGLAVLVGIGFEVRGYITMVLTMDLFNRSAATLRTLKGQPIKTDCIWMPMVIPDLYWSGNVFKNTDNPEWEKNLKKTGRDSYLHVTMDACDTDPIDQELLQYSIRKDGLEIEEISINK